MEYRILDIECGIEAVARSATAQHPFHILHSKFDILP